MAIPQQQTFSETEFFIHAAVFLLDGWDDCWIYQVFIFLRESLKESLTQKGRKNIVIIYLLLIYVSTVYYFPPLVKHKSS